MPSSEAAAADGDDNENKDRLTRLLKFLERGVESEERVSMAVNGFSMPNSGDRQSKAKDTKGKAASSENLATASALFSNKVKNIKCVICGDDHDNAACEKS